MQSSTGHAHALTRGTAEWVFGAGEKARTSVSQVDRDTYAEHGLSYFASTKSMALTPGHDKPEDIRYTTFDPEATTLKCFHCHSTGPLAVSENGAVQTFENGVRCESCHGPGEAHVASGGRRGTILNPQRLNGFDINELCGSCHRSAPETDWTDKWKTRHQPSYLAQSACFRKSAGAMSCVTCHDPHAPLVTSSAQYDAQCSACHRNLHHTSVVPPAKHCIDCHMPQVTISPQLKFTNHWIGIYAQMGSNLLPVRSVSKDLPPVRRGTPQPDAASLLPLFRQHATPGQMGLFLLSGPDAPAAEGPLREALATRREPDLVQRLGELLMQTGRADEGVRLLREAAVSQHAQAASRAAAILAEADPASAEEHYRAALKNAAGDVKRSAILMNNLATTLKQKKDHKGALTLYRQALALQPKDSPAAASTMSNLGSLLETIGQHTEAERMERSAIAIFERTLGPSSAELATSCTNLADILWSKGDRSGAAPLYSRAISVDESVYGKEAPEVAADLVNYGSLLKEMRDARSTEVLQRALSIFEKAGSPEAAQVRQLLTP